MNLSLAVDPKISDRVRGVSMLKPPISFIGTHPIELQGEVVGDIDIAYAHGEMFVSVTIEDCFLTIEQWSAFMSQIQAEFQLPRHQRVNIQQR